MHFVWYHYTSDISDGCAIYVDGKPVGIEWKSSTVCAIAPSVYFNHNEKAQFNGKLYQPIAKRGYMNEIEMKTCPRFFLNLMRRKYYVFENNCIYPDINRIDIISQLEVDPIPFVKHAAQFSVNEEMIRKVVELLPAEWYNTRFDQDRKIGRMVLCFVLKHEQEKLGVDLFPVYEEFCKKRSDYTSGFKDNSALKNWSSVGRDREGYNFGTLINGLKKAGIRFELKRPTIQETAMQINEAKRLVDEEFAACSQDATLDSSYEKTMKLDKKNISGNAGRECSISPFNR